MGAQVTRDETKVLIGGTWVEAGDGTYDIVNPATEQVVGQAPNASVDDANAAAAARFGLQGIQQRTRLWGASAQIDSAPGKGTTITVDFPLILENSVPPREPVPSAR